MSAPVQAATKSEINFKITKALWFCFAGEVACPRRRDDRITRLFLLRLLTAANGTKRTSRDVCLLCAIGCKADIAGS